MSTKYATKEFRGFLDGKDIVDAGNCAKRLRQHYSIESFGPATEGRFVEHIAENGGSFYTGQLIAPFSVRSPSDMYFCSVPNAGSKGKKDSWHQISKTQFQYGVYLVGLQTLTVPYISVWDDGVEIKTTANIDMRTGGISDIKQSDVHGLNICERQYIIVEGQEIDVQDDMPGFDYWADVQSRQKTSHREDEITTQCVNGTLRKGDLAISIPSTDYSCLVGRVLTINLLGSPEHEQETCNDTDDVHMDFTAFDYSDKRIKEIEEMFSALYCMHKPFEEAPIDDTIMAPDTLIRITGIDERQLEILLGCGYDAACYCYDVLQNLYEQNAAVEPELPVEPTTTGLQLSDTIETAVTLSGFEVIDAGRGYLVARHGASDTDFKISMEELVK